MEKQKSLTRRIVAAIFNKTAGRPDPVDLGNTILDSIRDLTLKKPEAVIVASQGPLTGVNGEHAAEYAVDKLPDGAPIYFLGAVKPWKRANLIHRLKDTVLMGLMKLKGMPVPGYDQTEAAFAAQSFQRRLEALNKQRTASGQTEKKFDLRVIEEGMYTDKALAAARENGLNEHQAVTIVDTAQSLPRMVATLDRQCSNMAIGADITWIPKLGIEEDTWQDHPVVRQYVKEETANYAADNPDSKYVREGFCSPFDQRRFEEKVRRHNAATSPVLGRRPE